MRSATQVAVIGAVGLVLGASAPPLIGLIGQWIKPPKPPQRITLTAAIMRSDVDSQKRHVIKGVDVYASPENSNTEEHKTTDINGLVEIPLPSDVTTNTLVGLRFHHPCYQEFDETIAPADKVPYTIYLWQVAAPVPGVQCDDPAIIGISLTFRETYLTRSVTFQVPNRGTVRCRHQPCSPDGKWQANIVAASLDAGSGNTFAPGHGRVACVSGPCPWTQIVSNGFSGGGPRLSVSIRNWSDTVTFVLTGELVGPPTNPVTVSGNTFDFSVSRSDLPNLQISAQTSTGQSLVNDIRVGSIPWATCQITEHPSAINYHCTLGPDYSFNLPPHH